MGVGGGVRYLFGDLDLGQNYADSLPAIPGVRPVVPYEVEFTAEGDVDAISFDARGPVLDQPVGLGRPATGTSAELEDSTSYDVEVRDITIPELADPVARNLGNLDLDQSFELPASCAPASGSRPTRSCASSSTWRGRCGRGPRPG